MFRSAFAAAMVRAARKVIQKDVHSTLSEISQRSRTSLYPDRVLWVQGESTLMRGEPLLRPSHEPMGRIEDDTRQRSQRVHFEKAPSCLDRRFAQSSRFECDAPEEQGRRHRSGRTQAAW